ncbi:MmgE/PrpD family protein [Candidimonas nitroreducens]|uniref:2-methylcitrate dehydratase n=1 Tax=Candidimonas nitroreducens TaxID=683354 RepID=A0A225MFJ5_9BURK|nr:MmgE/PrpD family protein [Candidimonas nitroreducens]OWT60087.1 hypothetical protein CEY11_10445 [Candidimonas nitroreducens]
MSGTLIARLAGLAEDLRFDNLSSSTVGAAKRAVLDGLGCAIAGTGCPPARLAMGIPVGGAGQATVIGEAQPSTLERAILLNGIMLRYLDMMDVYWAKDVCHPAENITVALAAVESAKGSGRALIEAVVAGYEAQMRLTHLLSLQGMGMHHVSAAGIVAPIVIGSAWRLRTDVVEQAVALSGCKQFTLHALSKGGISMAKAIGYPWSAMQSVLGVRLAEQGFSGPVHFLDWLTTEGPAKASFDAEALQPNATPLIERVSFKQFPVQFELQTPNEVALRLHEQIQGRRISAVRIAVPPITAKRTADANKFHPKNRETADHSLPVTVAMTLLDGKLTAAQFEHDRWAQDDVATLAGRTTVSAEEELALKYPQGRPARVTVVFEDGQSLQEFQDVPYGDVARPLDDIALEKKFLANAASVVGEPRAREIADRVGALENLADITELTRLLAAG